MTKGRFGGGFEGPPGGGRPGRGEAVAMLAAVGGIVMVQRLGFWPEALQGTAGLIVQAIVVLVSALPWGLRRGMSRLRRRGGVATAMTAPDATADDVAGDRDDDAMARIDPGARRDGEVGARLGPTVVVDADEMAESADYLADFLPDPTMWPSWPPVADNDDEAERTSERGGEAEPTAM